MRRFLASLQPWRQGYDWLGILYVVLSGFLPLLNPACFAALSERGPLHALGPHLALHAVVAAAIYVVPPVLRRSTAPGARLLGVIYLPLLFPWLYGELAFLGVVFRDFGQSFDPLLIDLEQRVFGLQPSLAWSRAWPWRWLLEVMEFAYFTYYFFAIIGLVLIWRTGGRGRDRNWALSAALIRDLGAVMLSCYAWYAVFPVWGPKYFEYLGVAGSVESEGLRGWLFSDVMRWIHANGALCGAAFPSSHVAGSMVSWWWGWKVAPRHRWWFTTLWAMLTLSIVYCRYHYVVDLVGGVAWAAFVMWLTARYMAAPADGLRRDTGSPAGR
ncbi:MAG TPA: phosphatase PAP2 family protein [Candidatus Krumholzibacteria bacterium]|nr:phosphatase PAP2 family protein [Candidatus Krumholzibacteria bacterium]HPD72097.1 phosphatase PAP2 family protein [Candidatus Krumholzibacteria bacterium]HRY40971.1 phosphatase PAP2 family protein [Candidatus Krumholzibacteria bacterium]